MLKLKWLQIFAEGGSGDGGAGEGGAESGVESADSGQARLLELGVPEDKIRKRAKNSAAVQRTPQVAVAEENISPEEAPSRRSLKDMVTEDPELNKELQHIISSRVKGAKQAEEILSALSPVLELVSRDSGIDLDNLDLENAKKLAEHVNNDTRYYEDRALEMGVSVETAREIDQSEREKARVAKKEKRDLQQKAFEDHINKLQQQGEELKRQFPGFDLATELQNEAFARMTSPNVGLSVEDAYFAVHRKEMMQRGMQITAQKTAQKLSNAIRSGTRRPAENGTTGQSASVTTFDYSHATKAEREALKRSIRSAAARGEKIYPGQR